MICLLWRPVNVKFAKVASQGTCCYYEYRILKKAGRFAEAKCPECKVEFDMGLIQEKNVSRWEFFMQVESGILTGLITEEMRKQCVKCKNQIPMKNLMVDACEHFHCEGCIKEMMKKSLGGDKKNVECAECLRPFENYILQSADPHIYKNYIKAVKSVAKDN